MKRKGFTDAPQEIICGKQFPDLIRTATSGRKFLLFGVLLALVLCATGCVVHERTAVETPVHITVRIDNQQRQIDSGIASGMLLPADAQIVRDNLNGIQSEYARLRNEGKLTPHEIDRIERMLDRNAGMINHATVPMRMYR